MSYTVFYDSITSDASQVVTRVLKYFEKPMYDRVMSDINKHKLVFQPILIYCTPVFIMSICPTPPPP